MTLAAAPVLHSLGALSAPFVLGAALGAWHFGSLRWSCGRVLARERGRPAQRAAAFAVVQLLRLLVLCGALAWTARHGAWPLLAAAAGILAARQALFAAAGCASRRRPRDPSKEAR